MFGHKTDKIVLAIGELSEAKREYEEAHRAYEGYSWGWAGQHLQERVERCEKELGEALDEYIDARIKEALDKLTLTN